MFRWGFQIKGSNAPTRILHFNPFYILELISFTSDGLHNLCVKETFREVYERFPSLDCVYLVLPSFFSFFFLICHVPFHLILIVNFRDQILCDLRAWCTIHGATTEGNIWAIHWLCVEEPILWNGNANSVWAVWSQPLPGCAKGPGCTFGPLNLMCNPSLLFLHCFFED